MKKLPEHEYIYSQYIHSIIMGIGIDTFFVYKVVTILLHCYCVDIEV